MLGVWVCPLCKYHVYPATLYSLQNNFIWNQATKEHFHPCCPKCSTTLQYEEENKEQHVVKDIIDKEFRQFVFDNSDMFELMGYNDIINILHENKANGQFLISTDILKEPYNVMYIGKRRTRRGDVYTLLNDKMNVVYIHLSTP